MSHALKVMKTSDSSPSMFSLRIAIALTGVTQLSSILIISMLAILTYSLHFVHSRSGLDAAKASCYFMTTHCASKVKATELVQGRLGISKKFTCPPIYGCKCGGRPRARSTVLLHKKTGEARLRLETGNQRLTLPSAIAYTAGVSSLNSDTLHEEDDAMQGAVDENMANIAQVSSDGEGFPGTGARIDCSGSQVVQAEQDRTNGVLHFKKKLYPAEEDQPDGFIPTNSGYELRGRNLEESESIDGTIQVPSFSSDEFRFGADSPTVPLDTSTQDELAEDKSSSSDESSVVGSSGASQLSLDHIDPNTRIGLFLDSHSDIVYFWLQHKVSDSAMDSLLLLQKAPFKRWKSVKEALFRVEDVRISEHPMCSEGHEALKQGNSGIVRDCSARKCSSPVTQYSYIGIWERLLVRLQSSVYGPELFEYHHSQLQKLNNTCSEYTDFYSGKLFSEFVQRSGGTEQVQYDIFLFLSGDGAQPYTSSMYDFWPFVLLIGNLPPSKRVKVSNMLPVTCIPGPHEPRDLVSFLIPLIDEMEALSKGIECTLWDGSRVIVRVHIFLLLADLPALAKLSRIKGSNALRPCRVCMVEGWRATPQGTLYYPSFLIENGRRKQLWNPKDPTRRTVKETKSSIREIKRLLRSTERGSIGMRENLCKSTGINGESLLFARLRSLSPYQSCPIDIMHLLLLNIAPNLVELFYQSGMIDSAAEKVINVTLSSFGSGVPSLTRRPRTLKYRKMFKAEEWKFFVLHSSLVVLHDVLPKEIMDGWLLFSRLVDLSFRPYLSEGDVMKLGELAVQFYSFVEEELYRGDPDNVHVCKYSMHLVLHLEEYVRLCGPLLNVSQFPMERFIGETVAGITAKNLAAESVIEQWRLRESYKSFVIRSATVHGPSRGPPLLSRSYIPRSSLCVQSTLPDFKNIVFCHPREDSDVVRFELKTGVPLRKLLETFYQSRMGMSESAAAQLVIDNESIELWDRMAFAESFEEESRVLYFGRERSGLKASSRRNFYIAAEFAAGASGYDSDSEAREVYFGRVRRYISHSVKRGLGTQTFLLVLADWVDRGLKQGNQDQVYAEMGRDDARLFRNATIEGADVLQRHVFAVETTKVRRGRKTYRTYFVDPESKDLDLLNRDSKTVLRGF